jgi:hypothetical protein
MPRFPKKEADIVALAERLWQGLWSNRPVYPQPPTHPLFLRFKMLIYKNRQGVAIAAQATSETAIAIKNEALSDLTEALKSNIRYAENTVDYDDGKLKLIGWAGKKTATVLAPPGQARLLEAPKQGKGWLFLDWKAPVDGGKPAAYKVERRLREGSGWQDAATAILTETTLVDQPEKQELEYRIIAVNKSGEGQPSNTVMVVL